MVAIASIATTRAGNLHTCVLANAIANLPIHGKSIFLKHFSNYSISTLESQDWAASLGLKMAHPKYSRENI